MSRARGHLGVIGMMVRDGNRSMCKVLRGCFLLSAMAFSAHAQPLTFTTFAGVDGGPGSADGPVSLARFNNPLGVATDSAGNIYVADTSNQTIRKITPAGMVSTLAGLAGFRDSTDGTGSVARFNGSVALAIDSGGNVFVAEEDEYTIRKITPSGLVTTLAGSAGLRGSADGTGSAARFFGTTGVATDKSGNVYVGDAYNSTIRKITPAGVVTTLAGSAGLTGSVDGIGSAARFNLPFGVATDSGGNIYVADTSNFTIRKISSDGVVTTLAGSAGLSGNADGTGNAARFQSPAGVATDDSGNVYVTEVDNSTIRKITPAGVVTTLAGSAGLSGSTDGTGSTARFNFPFGVATDSSGNVYVADAYNNAIRKITPAGVVTTLAGVRPAVGSEDGTGNAARFNTPLGVAADAAGNLYVADLFNHGIRKITSTGTVTTLAGSVDFFGIPSLPGSAPYDALLGVTTDMAGNIYVASYFDSVIRKVTQAGMVTTLTGTFETGGVLEFNRPSGMATDSGGNVFLAESFDNNIRKITPFGLVTILAGIPDGTMGLIFSGQGSADGTGSGARFYRPSGVATDGTGNIYVADSYNSTIRKITPAGVVTTLAGSPDSPGYADGFGSAARFGVPEGIAIDSGGNIFVADSSTIRKISPARVVTTVAGTPGLIGSADGTGSAAQFNSPRGLAVDSSGNV